MSSSGSSAKVCFNSNCKETLERPRKGWRRRTGEFADLCDRCASAYEEGKFCETFHLNASGWRCCESCGKQIHCGCIVSFHTFVLLDAGGIECITCARKSFILTPNPAWPPPSLFLPLQPEKVKDAKNWSPMAGSGPVPWRQASSFFNGSTVKSELQPRVPLGGDLPCTVDRFHVNERMSVFSPESKKKEDLMERSTNGSLIGVSKIVENGTAGLNSEGQPKPCVMSSQQSSISKADIPIVDFSFSVTSASKNETNDHGKTATATQRTLSPLAGKQFNRNGIDSSTESQGRSGRPRGDGRGRNQLLPRYWPRITDQELQQLSGDSNSVITPLFEKMLSASDAGRIGRLVLPKKCAEAYFPPISHPEGLPLKVQDLKGKEWVFQFRFWPNNNSRMYVLEGITPCIQSMQLQAGDVVTFSRVEPEGKLVMGCRKASSTSLDQGNETSCTGSRAAVSGEVNGVNTTPGEGVPLNRHLKGDLVSPSSLSRKQTPMVDSTSTWLRTNKSGYVAKEIVEVKSSIRNKRKNSTLGSKSKRLRIENEDMIELKITWGQAQMLFRPAPNDVPKITAIEECEFEEFEEAPVIGRPTIPATDHLGEDVQWVQCEDCFKWRKVPAHALLPSRWTCFENLWDSDRALCSTVQELTAEELEDLLPLVHKDASKKSSVKQESDAVEALEGLDTLANLAIQDEGEAFSSSSQATTRHPRHKPGCSCIVCIQPPSGKGPKHKHSCGCNVCETVRRRFKTLMSKREKKQSEKEAETADQKLRPQPEEEPFADSHLSDETANGDPSPAMKSNDCYVDNSNDNKAPALSFKGQIDLNIQPEREEDLSPGSNSGGMVRLLRDATARDPQQQRLAGSGSCRDLTDSNKHHDEIGAANSTSCVGFDSACQSQRRQ